MAKFFASTGKGLRDVLENEIKDMGIQRVWTKDNEVGVYFEGSWEDCYKVNLKTRIASRIILPVLDFPAYQKEELYNNVLKHDFTKYINPDQGIYVDANVSQSPKFRDQRLVAMIVKDAICDQFRKVCNGERPSVVKGDNVLRVHVRMHKHQVSIAVDTSGYPLFQRGYREDKLEAPIKETLAAGLLDMSGWNGTTSIVDPMCGSGTILIEAALKAQKIAPGSLRTKFGFQALKNFDEAAWEKVLNECLDEELSDEEVVPKFFGFDKSPKAIKIAEANARKAGVDHLIEFKVKNIVYLDAPELEDTMIITNPPYGERLDDEYVLEDTYKDFGHVLREKFPGKDMWMISGNAKFPAFMKLKADRKIPVHNGPIECRFLHYKINVKS